MVFGVKEIIEDGGSLTANLFHGLLLFTFPFDFLQLWKHVQKAADAETVANERIMNLVTHLVASGLAKCFTKASTSISLPFGALEGSDNSLETDTYCIDFEKHMQLAQESSHFVTLWQDMCKNANQQPMFLFNFSPYWEFAVQDEERRAVKLFAEFLDFPTVRDRTLLLVSLIKFILRYYTQAQGFVALHCVSAIRALDLLESIVEDDAVFFLAARHLWRQVSFIVLVLEVCSGFAYNFHSLYNSSFSLPHLASSFACTHIHIHSINKN